MGALDTKAKPGNAPTEQGATGGQQQRLGSSPQKGAKDALRGMNYEQGTEFVRPGKGPMGPFQQTEPEPKPGAVRAIAVGDMVVLTGSGAKIGPFLGGVQQPDGTTRSRADIIAGRLNESKAPLASAELKMEGGRHGVRLADDTGLWVDQADAQRAGFVSTRLAAKKFASLLSGKPMSDDGEAGNDTGLLSLAGNQVAADYRKQCHAVTAQSDGSVLAYGVRLGPFAGSHEGRPRAELIAERLSALPSTAFRGARADGAKVVVGDQQIEVTDADAKAQGAKSPAEAAKNQATQLDGTWAKGAHADGGRRVLPAHLGPAQLFEFARAVAEGPGHTAVDTAPGQVTILGLRGVGHTGIYDPKLKAEDDLVLPMVIDKKGRRRALRLSGTVDPGGTSGGATQVGDATAEFAYSNQSGNSNLAGTPLLRPQDGGIEGKDLSGGVQSYADMQGKGKKQGATLIHFGTDANQSRGCTVISDKGSYSDNKRELTNVFNSGITGLGSEILDMDATDLEQAIRTEQASLDASGRKDAEATRKIHGMRSLLEMRRLEEAKAARYADDTDRLQARKDGLRRDKPGKPAAEGADIEDLAAVANYKAFLSMVYRDPEMRVRYVIVDGSKVPEWKGAV